jgi:hypothetical protein
MVPLRDLLTYVLFCGVLVCTGAGLLRLLRVPLTAGAAALLAPCVAQALWAVSVGASVLACVPLRYASLPIWGVTLALGLYGLISLRRWPIAGAGPVAAGERTAWILLAVCAAAGLLTTLPYFAHGLRDHLSSQLLDGWSYVSYGQYVWDYGRGTEGGLAPVYQWAVHLSGARHVSGPSLGFLSWLTRPGDTSSAAGLLQAGAFVSAACACASLALAKRVPTGFAALYVVLAVVSGWSLNVLWATNFDNALALTYLPALFAILAIDARLTMGTWSVVGLLVAAMAYTYPEFAVLTLAGLGFAVPERFWRRREAGVVVGTLLAIIVALVILSPYLTGLWAFVRMQARTGLTAARPAGSLFRGLITPPWQASAFWSLGGETMVGDHYGLRTLAGSALFLLTAIGLVRLTYRRELALVLMTMMLLCGAAIMIFGQAYSYGAYKLIVLGWWATTFAVITAVQGIASWPRVGRLAAAAGVVVCLSVPAAALSRIIPATITDTGFSLKPFRPLEQMAASLGTEPIALFSDEPIANHWAVYYLRHAQLRLGTRSGYLAMPHVQYLLSRAPAIPWERIHLLLRDTIERDPLDEHDGWLSVWHGDPYTLWDTGTRPWVLAAAATNPNGFEGAFFWLGGGPATFELVARRPGVAELSAVLRSGPSTTGTARRVQITDGFGCVHDELLDRQPLKIAIPVKAGENSIAIAPLDPITVKVQPNGDARALLVGVEGPKLHWTEASRPSAACPP